MTGLHVGVGGWEDDEGRRKKDAAFTAFYDEHFSAIVRSTMFFEKLSEAEAKDVVQDAMLALYMAWDGVKKPRGYVKKTIRRKSYDLRDRNSRLKLVADFADMFALDQAALRDQAREVDQLVDELPGNQRKIFKLKLAGYKPREIETILEMTGSTIRSNLRHARTNLTSRVNQERNAS